MHLIDGAGHVNNQFVPEDIPTGRPPTEITAALMNALQNEIANFIVSTGTTLNKNNDGQLRDALTSTFARSDSTIHYLGQVYNIVADKATLAGVTAGYLPEGTKILVTSYYGLHQAAMVTRINGAWVDSPLPLKVFDLWGTDYDNHGYYWFANAWNLFDVSAIQVADATEGDSGIIRLATWGEVLSKSLAAVALRPKHMADYVDQMFVGMFGDFASGVTPPPVWIPANGQLINRTERPLLWQHAQASGLLVADSAWSSDTGKFSSGNGTTTFRVPDLRGEFRRTADQGRGIDPGRQVGSSQGDAIRNITGSTGALNGVQGGTSGSGALRRIAGGSGIGNMTLAMTVGEITFDASKAPNVVVASENRPRSLAYPTHIYAGSPA